MNEDHSPTFDFDAVAERVRIPAGDVGHVVSTARRRALRQRRVLSATMAVAVVSSVVAVNRLSSAPDEELPVAATDGARRGSLGLTWRSFDPKSGLGMAAGVTNDGTLYALSTAPGQRELAPNTRTSGVVWRSDDGVEWSSVSTLGNDLYLSDLARADKRVYAVGTSPGEALASGQRPRLTSSNLIVGWSDDDGRTWKKAALPIDFEDARATRWGSVTNTAVAAGPRGVLAVAAFSADLDVPALLPAGVTAPRGWSTTDTGVDVLGAPKERACPSGLRPATVTSPPGEQAGEASPVWCTDGEKRGEPVAPQAAYEIAGSYTWAQLGIDGDLLRTVRRQPIAWLAEPGTTQFRRVELPDIGGIAGGLEVTAHEHGFDILGVVGDRFRADHKPALLQSGDGRAWRVGTPPTDVGWVTGAGTVGGRTAFVGGADNGSVFNMADGGGGWKSTSLDTLIDASVLDGMVVQAGAVSFGRFGVAIAAALVPRQDAREGSSVTVKHRILVSRDGATWDDIALDDIAGEPNASVTRIVALADRVVVTASLPIGGAASPSAKRSGVPPPRRQVVLVGTAA